MVVSHHQAVTDFENGIGGTKSNSMKTVTDDGYTALVGYGHAVYAVLTPSNQLVVFAGWSFRGARRYAGSMTTKSSHFSQIPTHRCDALVAYESADTGQERGFLNNADVVSDNPEYVAPKTHADWKQLADWALDQV